MAHSIHPRPMQERPDWQDLSGVWQFAFDDEAQWRTPQDVAYDREIEVPYPPESVRSGVHDTDYHHTLWYRRRVEVALPDTSTPENQRLYLHFGAVDYQAAVWVNGQLVAQHEGGHTPFSADVTEAASGDTLEIVVRAIDDPHDLAKPRGKQDWEEGPHDIWYPRTSGIWQTVWLERRAAQHLTKLVWTPNVERWEIGVEAKIAGLLATGKPSERLRLRVRLHLDDTLLADDEYAVTHSHVSRIIALPDPGIDAARAAMLWSPGHPQLIQATLELLEDGQVIDQLRSYTALRSVAVDQQHFILNGRPYTLRLVLDQGYWPDSLLSASDDELRRDVELTRLLGFNGARKHQKIENPRYLYWCDVIGLLVWEELPSAYAFSNEAALRLIREWTEAIERDRSHPCIVAWVPINESWGVPDLPLVAAQRQFVRALYHLTKALDPTRPVIGNDGWEYEVTDIIAIHDYTDKPAKLLARYGSREALQHTLAQTRPHSRRLFLGETLGPPQPAMLTEFGGIAYSIGTGEDSGWGYNRMHDPEALQSEYAALLAAVNECEGLVGFCYTQLTDTFQEKNGLLFEDRSPKTELAALARANRGEISAMQLERDPTQDPMGYSRKWRKKLALTQASSSIPQPAD
ncbi:glycoside hydrolase family 2 protein [Deinococcus sp.]|uniref:glycoside hydrolase family 2 protein n=1 Tax=Deinococcus sp. TaxID=47478 RepID=UPI003B5ADBE5